METKHILALMGIDLSSHRSHKALQFLGMLAIATEVSI